MLALIFAAALLFRIIMMVNHSYMLDEHELMSFELCRDVDILSIFAYQSDHWTESNGIFYYYILKLFSQSNFVGHFVTDNNGSLDYFGRNQIIYAKMLSVIMSFLSCCLIYKICKKVGNRCIGIYAVFLFAIHSGNICISDYIRFYSFNTFFCCLSTYLLLYLNFDKKISIYVKILYVLSLFACTSSMMCSSFLFIGHFVFCISKYGCKKKVLKFLFQAAFLHGIFFGYLWLKDIDALSRKTGYLDLFESYRWLYTLFYNIGFGVTCHGSMPTQFYGSNINFDIFINIYICLSVVFLLLIVLLIFRYYNSNGLLLPNSLKQNGLYNKTDDLLLLSLALLIFPSAMMLVIYPYSNIINYGNISFLQPNFVIFLAYFMYSAKKHCRWLFLLIILLSLPFSLATLSDTSILYTWQRENFSCLIKNFDNNMVISSDYRYITVYLAENKFYYIFGLERSDHDSKEVMENDICSYINNKQVQFWLSYSKTDKRYSDELTQSSLFNISKRVKKNPSIGTICINSDL